MIRRRRINWKAVRVTAQILAFLAFIAYFLAIVYPLKTPWRPLTNSGPFGRPLP